MSQLLPQQVHARDLRSKFFPTQPARPARQEPRPAPQPVRVEPKRGPELVVPLPLPTETICLKCPWEAMRPDGSHSQAYLLAVVSFAFDIPVAEIEGPGRSIPIARARHAAMWLLRRFGPTALRSLPSVGRRLARDHTTVLHGTRRAELAVALAEKPERDTPHEWARVLADLTPWPAVHHRGPSQGRNQTRRRRRAQISSLYFGHNYTCAEIAEKLGLEPRVVKGIIDYAKRVDA